MGIVIHWACRAGSTLRSSKFEWFFKDGSAEAHAIKTLLCICVLCVCPRGGI